MTFNAPVTIDLGRETLQLIPQEPAHRDGDVAVWLPSTNVLIIGDLLTNGSYPIIDESSCGSLRGMIEAIEQLLRLANADTVVVVMAPLEIAKPFSAFATCCARLKAAFSP